MSIRSFGSTPVGSFMPSPIANALLTLADGSQWLRAGLALAAAGYVQAATVAHLRAHRFTRTATQASALVSALATNGSGTFVAVVPGDATNVYTSTDGGQTWTARAHNIGIGACAIVWTGARFVAVGNNATTDVKAATSPDGVTWTLSSIATGLTATTAGTVDIAWDGSAVAVMVPGQDTTHTIYTSPSGLSGTWTARTIPASSQATAPYSKIGGGALGFVYTYPNNGGTSITYSTDHGVTWASVNGLPIVNALGGKPMVGSGFVVIPPATGTVSNYSANFTSWAGVGNSAAYYGTYVTPMAGGGWSSTNANNDLMTTTDGLNWTVQVMGDSDPTKPGPAATYRISCVGSTSIVLASYQGADYLHYATSTPTSANAVGGVTATGHWRIK